MIDEYNGILGLSSTVTTDVNKLFITSDGGITWTPILGYDSASNNNQLISAVYMTSDGSIMTVVRLTDILKSTDGGNTWQVAVSFTAPGSTNYGAGYYSVNDTVQYALGGNNTTFKTDNSGLGWASQSTDSTVNQSFLLSFYNEQEGYTSRFINNENKILRTFDSGVTWTAVDTAPTSLVTLESVLYNCGECPDNFTKANNVECTGKSLGPNQCPQGSIYDPITNTCTGAANCPPTEIVFVLDIGASVDLTEKQQMVDFLLNVVAANNITAGLNAGTIKLGFCTFAGNAPTSGGHIDLSSNTTVINNFINSITTLNLQGGTNTAAGLEKGISILFGTNSDELAYKKIILVTDGFPASLPNGVQTQTFILNNNSVSNPQSNSWTITNNTTPPCGRQTGASTPTDCTRCDIYTTTMEMATYIKDILGVGFTLAILTGETPVNLNSILSPVQNPSLAPTVEAYLAHRALITGYLDQMTHMFPPSQDPTSGWYIGNDGYKPPSPIPGGHLLQLGYTNQDTGISFGRLLYGSQGNLGGGTPQTSMGNYSSNASLTWPALPAIYGPDVLPALSTTTNTFNPLGNWDCNLPGDPPNPDAPMCGLKADGTLDAYISLFTDAATTLAPQIAQGICSSTSEVVCPEGCTPVPSGDNVRCECEKTLTITPCIFNIYDCSDLTTPVFCTANDISEYVGKDTVLSIAVNGEPQAGCYQASFSTIDYCEPLDFSDITITETYTSCADCAPSFTRLTSCMNEEIYIQVQSDYLTNNIGKSVELFEYPGLCWRIDYEPDMPEILTQVSVKQIYDDCDCCKQYSCKTN
jgi:hypothetical protein